MHNPHIAWVMEGLPADGGSGGAIFSWSVISYLRGKGHPVSCISVLPEGAGNSEAAERALDRLGVSLACVFAPRPDPNAYGLERELGSARTGRALAQQLEAIKPDVLGVFDTGVVAALAGYQQIPRLAIPGDPLDLVQEYRVRSVRGLSLSLRLRVAYALLRLKIRFPKLLLEALRQYEAVGYLGEQHAHWVKSWGIPCMYLRPPILDRAGDAWMASLKRNYPMPLRVLLLGGLETTATQIGLWQFARETLPLLQRRLGAGLMEVRIVGSGTMPEALRKALSAPGVVIAGYVEDTAEEFLQADIFCVPGKYPIGVRTRIIEALSWGKCLVADSSAAAGLSELQSGVNCLLAESGGDLAVLLKKAAEDSPLRHSLAVSGRDTYESSFALDTAGERLRMIFCQLTRSSLADAEEPQPAYSVQA